MPDALTGAATGILPQAPPAADPFSGMDSTAFLKLLVAQLRYQNPMAPSDPSAMLQQTSALRQVESLNQISRAQEQMVAMQQASMAAGLVGRHVTAVGLDGSAVAGTVDAVRFTAAGPLLVIGDREVPFDATAQISAAAPATPTDPTQP